MKCRPRNVCKASNVSTASLKKRLKLLAVTLSPRTRIQAHKQVSEPSIHKAFNLSSPARVNCCSVASLAPSTCRPAAVIL